jgi:hypothetical protein
MSLQDDNGEDDCDKTTSQEDDLPGVSGEL